MSLFNCITFAETTITKVEKQFIQQQQEQEQEQQEQHQQVQIQAEQTVHRKTKIKKHKKHTELIQQEPQQEEFQEITETFARESHTESLNIERLEHIEEVLQPSTTLATQNLPQSTHEIVVVAELSTELSTPKPLVAQGENDILPEKALAVNEEYLAFDELSSGLIQSKPVDSKLSEHIEIHERHAVSVTETQTKETPKELKSSKIPKLIKAERKIKESRPLLVEVPSVADSVEDLESLKAVKQQAHKGEIILSHELTAEQQSILDTVDSLKDLSTSAERAKMEFMEKEGLLVTESFRGETVDKEVSQEKPTTKKIVPEIIQNISLDISECQPENTVEELQPAAEVYPETSSSTLQELRVFSTSESKTLESVEEITQGYQPTKSLADVIFKSEGVPILVEEVQQMDTLGEELIKRQPVEAKALQGLVLTEGVIGATTVTQSPIEENLPTFEADSKEAQLSIETRSPMVTQEIVISEEYPSDLGAYNAPKNIDAIVSQTSSLTVGETQETNLVETTENLIQPTTEPTKNVTESISQPFGTAVENQNISYETVETIDKSEITINQGKVNVTEGELVAEVQSQTIIDSERAFKTEVPETAKGKLEFVQQKALDVTQDTIIERENKLLTEERTLEQTAVEQISPSQLRVTSVMEVQPQQTATDIESENIVPTSASQAFETKPIGVASQHEQLESTESLKITEQPKGKSGQLLIYENQQPLEISDVQVSETSTELIDSTHSKIMAKKTTNTFTHAEHTEVLLLESTSEYTTENKPNSALAELTMPTQYSTDTMQQDTLDSCLPYPDKAQPQQQIPETTFDLLHPLETISSYPLEQETSIEAKELSSLQSAAIRTSQSLQVANKSSSQHLETSEELCAKTEMQQEALMNISGITIPECAEVLSMEALKDYQVPAVNKSNLSNVEIIENPTALDITTTITCEETRDIMAPHILEQSILAPKLSDLNIKSPLIEEPNVLDYASELTPFSLTAEKSHPTISSFEQINVLETQTFDKETGLGEITQPIGQQVNISVDSKPGIVLSQQSTLESERDFTEPIVPLEHAKSVTSEMLRIPLIEGVVDNQAIGDLTDFAVSSKFATSSYDTLNETKTTEVLVFDNTLATAVNKEPECQSTQTIVPHEHTMITESVAIASVEEFEKTPDKPRTAITTRDSTSQLAVLETQNIFEAELTFIAESSQKFNAKINENVRTQLPKNVNEAHVYDSIAERETSEKCQILHAEVSHAMTIAPTIDAQELVEAEEILTSLSPISAAASTNDNTSKLQLPLNTSIHAVEDVKEFSTAPVTETIARSTLEGHNYEVTVIDSQCAENSEAIAAPNVVSVRAIESLNEFFKGTPELTHENVYQKESYIPATDNSEIKAKPVLSDILQSTSTTDIMPFEVSEPIKPTEAIMQEAKLYPFVISEANKLQTKHDDLILQKEELFLESHPVGYGKPFIEGTERETLISEIIPIENVGNLENTKNSKVEAKVSTTQTLSHKTISQVETFEKTEDFKEDLLKGTRIVNIDSEAETKCAKLTTTQITFIKEDSLSPLHVLEETAKMSNLANQPLVIEEIVSVGPIEENYELRKPTEGTAKMICEAQSEVVTVTEQLTFEESPAVEIESSKYSTPSVDLVESSMRSVQTLTANVFENIEGYGDFRPQSGKSSTDLTSEKNVSVVEEVSVVPSLGEIIKRSPEMVNATAKDVLHNNVIVSNQQIFENVNNLLENITPAMQTSVYAPFDEKNAALFSEVHEKGTLIESKNPSIDLEHAKPLIMPYSSCLSQQTITEEEVITPRDENTTQAKNANVIFEADKKYQVTVTNIMEKPQTLMPQTHVLESKTLIEKQNNTKQTIKVLKKDTTVDCQSHFESQLQSTPKIEYEGLSLSETIMKGKYKVRLILSRSKKGVLLPLPLDPQKQNTYNTKQTTYTNKIKTNMQFFTQIQNKPQTQNTHNKQHQHK